MHELNIKENKNSRKTNRMPEMLLEMKIRCQFETYNKIVDLIEEIFFFCIKFIVFIPRCSSTLNPYFRIPRNKNIRMLISIQYELRSMWCQSFVVLDIYTFTKSKSIRWNFYLETSILAFAFGTWVPELAFGYLIKYSCDDNVLSSRNKKYTRKSELILVWYAVLIVDFFSHHSVSLFALFIDTAFFLSKFRKNSQLSFVIEWIIFI